MEITTIGLDIAKRVFQAHGADATGKAVLRRKLQRAEVLTFFGGQAGAEICTVRVSDTILLECGLDADQRAETLGH